ncbi:predicted protein [Histoplasma capsulatum G186AR]|uniref:Uncharacterized protein n=1 Tax=Ajellomyces capsulatus (strain G186AR / H82 / ATCC MYA-2454 / RMSCC 2432) TaxID=447093 RepID=C0NK79_AJECG|nr:uncharacterized protein HCBG_03559 [Histoplasma capsulatum G186AR]EEH08270.1 predicted protein [Histoplasma capsulatum G186AR]
MTHRSIASQERTGCLVTAAAGRAAQAVQQTAETPTLAPTRDSGVTAAVNACRTRDRAEERNRTRSPAAGLNYLSILVRRLTLKMPMDSRRQKISRRRQPTCPDYPCSEDTNLGPDYLLMRSAGSQSLKAPIPVPRPHPSARQNAPMPNAMPNA